MKFQSNVTVHAIKESKGEYEGRKFDSLQFHCEVDLAENGSGRSMGVVTRPFKCGPASDFDKWAHLGKSFPLRAVATFDMQAASDNQSKLVMVDITPLEVKKAA